MHASADHVYLDHNATTPVLPQVVEAMAEVYALGPLNPASQHRCGRRARQILDDAQDTLAAILGARQGDQLVFTSGGTEANNLALFGLAGDQPGHAVISAIEHPAISAAATRLRAVGWKIDILPVDADGIVELDRLAPLLRAETRWVSLMLANNETGVVQPVREAARICAARGIVLHTDAVQAVGKIPVEFAELEATTLAVSAHKFHGPPGIGALLVRQGTPLAPQLHGGFQQAGLRPGTEAVALVAGMRAALELWHRERAESAAHLAALRDQLERDLHRGWPDLVVNGHRAQRLPHTSNVAFPGLDRQALVMALDLAGISCSTGSACASGSPEPSPTLLAMGVSPAVLSSSLRFSLGQQQTLAEVAGASARILKICNELRSRNLKRPEVA